MDIIRAKLLLIKLVESEIFNKHYIDFMGNFISDRIKSSIKCYSNKYNYALNIEIHFRDLYNYIREYLSMRYDFIQGKDKNNKYRKYYYETDTYRFESVEELQEYYKI